MPAGRDIFLTGGTGFIGRHLIPRLVERGHRVRALVRAGSEHRLPAGCLPVVGDPLERSTFVRAVPPARVFVHLIGVAHPNPGKAREFRAIDLASARESAAAAAEAAIEHFVYLSVAQPLPIMQAYAAARAEGEAEIRARGLNATFVRPFYVLGPGRRWPYIVLPLYWLFERIPSKRETARRLGLITIGQMVAALVGAIESPQDGIRILGVEEMRKSAATPAAIAR